MCGICGIVTPTGSNRTITGDLITRMRDTMRHRGPDDAGIHLGPGVGLGHRRLAIVDLAGGHQPMYTRDQSRVIVYNGEVFNHPTLSGELESQGVRYESRCDTETVLHLFERDGTASPKSLRGMFAYAIWDRERRELFLARDRFGVKPLYYVLADDGTLFFASEIKALLAAGAVTPSMNLHAFPDFLANHAPSGEETMFRGVQRLLPGHTLVWREGTIRIERYWDLSFGGTRHTGSDADLVAEYRERLREAVRLRLMADVPLGMFLSGGIDSAAITALMSTLVSDPIKTFSVAFAEREANELTFARLVATRYSTDHHEIVVSPDEFFEALPRLVWHEDEPLAHPSSVPLYFVSRLAGQHVKVVLTGEGSDESLGGYYRYRKTLLNMAGARWYHRLTPSLARQGLRGAIDALPRRLRLRRQLMRTFLYLDGGLDDLYFDNFAVFSRVRQRTLIADAVREEVGALDPYAAIRAHFETSDATSGLDRMLDTEIHTYLHELLMKQDQMSMAASIESRVPFLDHPLMMFAASLPERLKIRGSTTKYVLRQAMKDLLPPEILDRPKMGFPVPIGRWLRGPFKWVVDDLVLGERTTRRGLLRPDAVRTLVGEHRDGAADHSERLWALVTLELWHRIFMDGEDPADALRPPTRSVAVRVGA